jgi:hypothetical protein
LLNCIEPPRNRGRDPRTAAAGVNIGDARVADRTLFWRSVLAISMRFAPAGSYGGRSCNQRGAAFVTPATSINVNTAYHFGQVSFPGTQHCQLLDGLGAIHCSWSPSTRDAVTNSRSLLFPGAFLVVVLLDRCGTIGRFIKRNQRARRVPRKGCRKLRPDRRRGRGEALADFSGESLWASVE